MPEIKNLTKAAKRILKAVKDGERVILYGDADLDGVSSVLIFQETIECLRPEKSGDLSDSTSDVKNSPTSDVGSDFSEITIYFPDREKEGYGLNEQALKFLDNLLISDINNNSKALLIILDTGIGNVAEVELAKKLGFEVIIVDHHQSLPQIPQASIIVDPKQKSDPYPFKHLACAGVVYKLAQVLMSLTTPTTPIPPTTLTTPTWRPEKFLELVALAILYDQMPLEGENKKLVTDGILALKYTKRPGLLALIRPEKSDNLKSDVKGVPTSDFGPDFSGLGSGLVNRVIDEVRQKLVSPLAAGQIKNHISETYLLLIETSPSKAKKMAQALIKKAEQKREEIKKIFAEVESRIDISQPLVFEGDPSWPVILLGPAASKVCHKYKLPCFLFQKGKSQSKGGVRMPARNASRSVAGGHSDLDAVKAMTKCSHLLKQYGGHAPAAGFTIKNENLPKFKKCLIDYFK